MATKLKTSLKKRVSNQKSYWKNRDRILKHDKEFYQQHKEEIKKLDKVRYQKNRDIVLKRQKQYCKKHKKFDNENSKAYFRSPTGRYNQARQSARYRKLVFTLPLDVYINLVKQNCYYCDKVSSEHGIGLDRIDNSKKKGYTLDNVLPCCGPCNIARGNRYSVEEFKVMIQALMYYRKEHNCGK